MLDPRHLPPLTEGQYELLDAAAGHHAPTRRFLHYVLVNQLRPTQTSRRPGADRSWVDVPSPFMKKHFRGTCIRQLAGLSAVPEEPLPIDFASQKEGSYAGDVLEYQRYYPGQSRSFRVKQYVVDIFIRESIRSAWRARRVTLVDASDGREVRRVPGSPTYDRNRKPYPPLVDAALRALGYGQFDAEAVEDHLRTAEAALRREPTERKRRRFENDWRCYEAVLRQRPVQTEGGVYKYRLAYTVASSGRLYHVGGGLQTCSGAMKALAYGSLPGVHNYDLASSQLVVLAREMEEAGIPAPHVRRYLEEPGFREAVAARVGVDEGTFKQLLYAALFGAPLFEPRVVREGDASKLARRSELVSVLTKWLEEKGHEDSWWLAELYERFHGVVAPVEAEVEEWRRYVVEEMALETGKHTMWRGQRLLHNRLGMRLNLDEIGDVRKRRRQAAAHVLQGREAVLIHRLTYLAAKRGIRVTANEHDGIVTLGEVVKEDVEGAKVAAGLPEARLEEKPF